MASNIENNAALNNIQCDELKYGIGAVGGQANGETSKLVAQSIVSDALIPFVVAHNDTRFLIPPTTTNRNVTINPCGAPRPVLIPVRFDSYRRSRSRFQLAYIY